MFGPVEESGLYHPSDRSGSFSLLSFPESWPEYQNRLKQDPKARRVAKQETFRVSDMSIVLARINREIDVYLSTSRFIGSRKTVNFKETSIAFVDFDSYATPLGRGRSPEQQADVLLHYCQAEGIPLPSLIIDSGRGLHAKWLFNSPVPAPALLRWKALESHLIASFPAEFGADPKARDITRVLRLVGSFNTKVDKKCRVISVSGDAESPTRYGFDWLCDEILPLSRAEISDDKAARLAREKAKQQRVSKQSQGNLIARSIRETWWLRYRDIIQLAAIRRANGTLVGWRQILLFWALNALAQSGAIEGQATFWSEVATVAKLIDPYFAPNDVRELYRRHLAHKRGETVVWNGKERSPLYAARTATLIEVLGITRDEMAAMQVLVDSAIVDERRRERDKVRYAPKKAANISKVIDRDADILQMYRDGVAQGKIADKHNLTRQAVGAIIRRRLAADDMTRK